jgi:integrase
MVPDVANALARLLQRTRFTRRDDLLFPSETGEHLDGSALRRRYKAAQKQASLRPLRFHDLRHTFGSLAITRGSTVQVQHWMGHADARTTARYTHYKSRADEARLLEDAFRVAEPIRFGFA